MKIINKDSKIYNAMGWFGIVIAAAFILINLGVYIQIQNFAKEYNADEIQYGLFENNEYPATPNADQFGAGERIDYVASIVKFYRDGEDIVLSDQLFYEFNDLNVRVESYVWSYSLLITLILVFSFFGFMAAVQSHQFAHAHILGAIMFIVNMGLEIKIVLHWFYTPFAFILLMTYIYLIARTRFCDYDENLFTGIFYNKDLKKGSEEMVNAK
jgi:hypothetical protein